MEFDGIFTRIKWIAMDTSRHLAALHEPEMM